MGGRTRPRPGRQRPTTAHLAFGLPHEARRGARPHRAAQQQLDQGTYTARSHLTFGAYLVDEWLPAKASTIKPTTLASYEMHVHKHLVPRLGAVELSALRPGHLNAFYAALLANGRRDGRGGLSPTTVRLIHATVHKALADAVRWGRLARNPASRSDPPRAVAPTLTVWSADQIGEFMAATRSDDLHSVWLLAATTGMRRGEVLGLRWRDVDLVEGLLSVRHIRTVARSQVVVELTPKTAKGARRIALDPTTVGVLRHLRKETGGELDGLVFRLADGLPIHPERFTRWFARRCREVGLPPIRLHDVRHSYVTALISAGVPLKVVSERVGHASPAITMALYQHVLGDDDRAAAAAGAKAIFGE